MLRFSRMITYNSSQRKLPKKKGNVKNLNKFVCQIWLISSYILSDLGSHIDGHGFIDSPVDADREYIYFIGSEMLPSSCYIHFNMYNVYFF